MPSASDRQLKTWDEIAAFLVVSSRTAQLWEAEHGLPVHRLPGPRGTVFSSTNELTHWLSSVTELPVATATSIQRSRELDGWKAIACHLDVPIRTAQVWESTRGLPIHRLPGSKGRVFALVPELKRWKFSGEGPKEKRTRFEPESVDEEDEED